ncbi:MAG: riboflavin synthase [Fimbriimonadaceae bacterium]
MFTGIVQQVGEVSSFTQGRLQIRAQFPADDPIVIGESISINGCCLTVVNFDGALLDFDLSEETVRLTTTGQVTSVNIERAMRANDRLGGHFVQGHVDGVGRIVDIQDPSLFTFEFPEIFQPLVSSKGSIAVDGISLTVVEPRGNVFDVWVIPHTLMHTNLCNKAKGDSVNLEFDMLAKHVQRMVAVNSPTA